MRSSPSLPQHGRRRPRGSPSFLHVLLLGLCFLTAAAIAAAAEESDFTEADVPDMVAQGEEWVNKRNFDGAKAILSDAIAISPSYPEAYIQLGRAHAFTSNLAEAERLYKHALVLQPSFAPAHTSLGKLYLFQKQTQKALVEFKRALDLSPDDGDAYLGLARLEAQQAGQAGKEGGKEEGLRRAAELYGKAVGMEPTKGYESAWFDFGVLLSQLGRHDEAAEKFEKATALNERMMDFEMLGQVYQSFAQYPRALAAYERALSFNTRNPSLLYAIGQVSEALGLNDQAVEFYKKRLGIKSSSSSSRVHASLGLLLAGVGVKNMGAPKACGVNREEAKKHLTAALKGWKEEEDEDVEEKDEAIRNVVGEALAFCEEEEREVEVWRGRVKELKEKIALPPLPPSSPSLPHSNTAPKQQVQQQQQQQPRNPVVRQLLAFLRLLNSFSSRLSSFVSSFFRKAQGSKEGEEGKGEGVWLDGKKIKSIPSVRIESKQVLMETYMAQNTPCVISNFQEGFKGREEGLWTHAGLSEAVGKEFVRVSLSATGRFDGPEDGALWRHDGGGGEDEVEEVLVRPPQTSMRMDDFLSLLRLSQANPSLAPNATFYLEYLSLTQYLGPALLPSLPLPPPAAAAVAAGAAGEEGGLELLLTNLWVGKGGTTSPLHYDDYENILCQLAGRKELTLFPPMDIFYLYYTTRVKGELKYVYPDTFERMPVEGLSKVVFGSSVLLEDPDLTRHPEVVKATPYRVSLKEGECLYLPAYWHHEVKSVADEGGGLNVAVNYWFKNVTRFEKEGAGLAAATRAEKERKKRMKEGKRMA